MAKYVLITGVSTGIGLAAAKELVGSGYHVFGSVRKSEDAQRLQNTLGDTFTPLIFDVTDQNAVQQAADQVAAQIGDHGLSCLVNNAGIAKFGPLMHIPLDEVKYQLEVNVVGGILGVTQAFLPLLGARENCPHPPGKIINISSVGGKEAMPFIGPYVASKHAVEGISKSLRRELLIFGIDVIILGPGAVKTPIWDKGVEETLSAYANTLFEKTLRNFLEFFKKEGDKGLNPMVVGNKIKRIIENPKPRTRYAVAPNMLTDWWLVRLIPDRIMDKMLAKEIGMTRLENDKAPVQEKTS